MFKIEGETIHCTRGDIGNISFSCNEEDGTTHVFNTGDRIIFKVYEKNNVSNVVLKKEYVVTSDCNSVVIELDSNDTTIGDLINKKTIYNYEISINDEQTVIGFDENGGKEFILYPEGGETK